MALKLRHCHCYGSGSIPGPGELSYATSTVRKKKLNTICISIKAKGKKIYILKYSKLTGFYGESVFWPHPRITAIPRPGIEPLSLQCSKPQQCQCQILNLLHHQGTPKAGVFLFFFNLWFVVVVVWGFLFVFFLVGFFGGFFVFVFVLLFRATPMAYGGSQTRGRIGAVAAGLHHSQSIVGSKSNLHHSSWQWWILNPLMEARDQTHILMDTNWIRFH